MACKRPDPALACPGGNSCGTLAHGRREDRRYEDADGPRLGAALHVHEPKAESWHELHRESSALIWGAVACGGIALIDAIGKDRPACDCLHRQSLKGPERVRR